MENLLKKPIFSMTGEEFLSILKQAPTKEKAPRPIIIKGVNNLARELSVTMPTIHKWKKAGKIPYSQEGHVIFFDLAEVREALKK